MARTRNTASIDMEIKKKQALLFKAKNRCADLENELEDLIKMRQDIISKEVAAAFLKSERTYEELMNFLNIE